MTRFDIWFNRIIDLFTSIFMFIAVYEYMFKHNNNVFQYYAFLCLVGFCLRIFEEVKRLKK